MSIERSPISSAVEITKNTPPGDEFSERFLAASREFPMNELFTDGGKWRPWYIRRMQRIENVCITHGICAHDIAHHLRVARNALVLNTSMGSGITDSTLFALILAHDMGYSFSGLDWLGMEAVNHAEREKDVLMRWARMYSPHTYVSGLEQYISALPGSRHEVLSRFKNAADEPSGSGIYMIPAVIKLADCLDYFHHDRVKHLPDPHADNTYHSLARDVEDYAVTYDQSARSIRFGVQMQDGGEYTLWKKLAAESYPEVWELGQRFSASLGLTFQVGQRTK